MRTQTFLKFFQVWNNMSISKWWQNFQFWLNYPFKDFSVSEECSGDSRPTKLFLKVICGQMSCSVLNTL